MQTTLTYARRTFFMLSLLIAVSACNGPSATPVAPSKPEPANLPTSSKENNQFLPQGSVKTAVLSSRGEELANADAGNLSVSGDGRFVTFITRASNLDPNDTNGKMDVYLVDRNSADPSPKIISLDQDGNIGLKDSGGGRISEDGSTIAFASASFDTSLYPKGLGNVFLVRLDANGNILRDSFTRISKALDGGQPNNHTGSTISINANGKKVVFDSIASNLTSTEIQNTNINVYLYEEGLGLRALNPVVERASGGAIFSNPVISARGEEVAYKRVAAATDTTKVDQIILHDLASDERILVTHSYQDKSVEAAGGTSYIESISADGRFVLYTSYATNLDPDADTRRLRTYLWDRQTGLNHWITKGWPTLDDDWGMPTMNARGDAIVVFQGKALYSIPVSDVIEGKAISENWIYRIIEFKGEHEAPVADLKLSSDAGLLSFSIKRMGAKPLGGPKFTQVYSAQIPWIKERNL